MGDLSRLTTTCEQQFAKKQTLLSMWQETAELLYPERADFTTQRFIGADFSSNLMNSQSVIQMRDSVNIIVTMLYQRNKEWVTLDAEDFNDDYDTKEKLWLQWASKRLLSDIYYPKSNFNSSIYLSIYDYWGFGNGVTSVEFNKRNNSLLFRNWHLRDMAWVEGYDGQVCEIYRKSKDTAYNINRIFQGNVSPQIKDALEKNPHDMFEYCHAVLPVDRYNASKKIATDYVSVCFETNTKHLLKEEAAQTMIYCVSQWQKISGSQYAYSKCAVAALPDLRMLQQLSLMILENVERSVDAPLYARNEIFRGDINRLAGGVTYLDVQPDQRISDAMMFEPNNTQGLTVAIQKEMQVVESIKQAFFLDRLRLPSAISGQTLGEFNQRTNELLISNQQIFEPLENNLTQPLCQLIFDTMMLNGRFGDIAKIPEKLQGADIKFKFENPLQKLIEQQKAQEYIETIGLITQAAGIDQQAIGILKSKDALRDTLLSKGTPAKWLNSKEDMEQMEQSQAEAKAMQQQIAMMQQGGEAAKAVGEGAQALGEMAQ